jgi:hypothetical protein
LYAQRRRTGNREWRVSLSSRKTQRGAPSAKTECVAADTIALDRGAARRYAARVSISRCQTAQFLHSRGAFVRPGFSSSQRPTPKRGVGGAPGGASLELVALVRRDPRLRGMGPPGQPGGRLSALHRGAVAQEPLPSPALPAGSGAKAPRNLAFLPAAAPGFRVRGLRAAVDATSRSAVRIVSGDAPHERGRVSSNIDALRSQQRS